jgi:hypothetical protein
MLHIESKPVHFCEWIEVIAQMVGYPTLKLTGSLAVIKHELPGGRTQTVWISPIGRDPHDNTIIGFSSPARKMGAGQFLSQQDANRLLRQNARCLHGGWAIQNIEGDDYLVMLDTRIAETMGGHEFVASVKAVAILADEEEKRSGQDKF